MLKFKLSCEQKKKLQKWLHSFMDNMKKVLELIKLVKDIMGF